MVVRHPSLASKALPTLWLMTDERMGAGLWSALERLPRGSGVVFRHFATPAAERAAIFARVSHIARRRRLVVVRGGVKGEIPHLYPAHSMREAVAARRARADLVLVSPIYPTRTHPGAPTLGPIRAALIARAARVPAIALGGMNAIRFKRLRAMGFAGWAAIDGLTPA